MIGLKVKKCNPAPPGGVVSNHPLGSQFGENAQIDWELFYIVSFSPRSTDTEPSLQRGYFRVTELHTNT